MERFSFFFAFYGLILGLAVTETLSGLAGYARERPIRNLEPQTALLAMFIFLAICATWIDAWFTLQGVSLSLASLWAPIMTATCYYLAAALVFPRKTAEYDELEAYFVRRKGFVAAMLLGAELFVTVSFLGTYHTDMTNRPAVFWLWELPYKLIALGLFTALIFVRGKRTNLAVLVALLIQFTVPYWIPNSLTGWIHSHFDRPHHIGG